MKTNTRHPRRPAHLVEIGRPVIRAIEVRTLADARALLWACAKARDFLPAICRRDDGAPLTNHTMRESPLPDARRFPSFRERIGYWEAALELDDPESHLGAAVIAALNTYHRLMMDNPLAAEPGRFTSIVAEAARDWADGELLAVTLYRKGAEAVAKRLTCLEHTRQSVEAM